MRISFSMRWLRRMIWQLNHHRESTNSNISTITSNLRCNLSVRTQVSQKTLQHVALIALHLLILFHLEICSKKIMQIEFKTTSTRWKTSSPRVKRNPSSLAIKSHLQLLRATISQKKMIRSRKRCSLLSNMMIHQREEWNCRELHQRISLFSKQTLWQVAQRRFFNSPNQQFLTLWAQSRSQLLIMLQLISTSILKRQKKKSSARVKRMKSNTHLTEVVL